MRGQQTAVARRMKYFIARCQLVTQLDGYYYTTIKLLIIIIKILSMYNTPKYKIKSGIKTEMYKKSRR